MRWSRNQAPRCGSLKTRRVTAEKHARSALTTRLWPDVMALSLGAVRGARLRLQRISAIFVLARVDRNQLNLPFVLEPDEVNGMGNGWRCGVFPAMPARGAASLTNVTMLHRATRRASREKAHSDRTRYPYDPPWAEDHVWVDLRPQRQKQLPGGCLKRRRNFAVMRHS